MYSIKAVTSITGLNAETLRAWERRYSAVVPQRDASGRRLYTHEDVERLTLLNNVRGQGHAISKIAGMQDVELQVLLEKKDDPTYLNREILIINVVDALMQYQLDRCEDLLRRGLIAMDTLSYAQDFLLPILQKVGEYWHEGKLTIAQEHMFSNCVKRIVLSMVHNMMPFSGHRVKLLFSTPCGEQHEFGILLSCLLAANQRCMCYYLGSNLPAIELITAQNQLKTDVVVLSLVNTSIDLKITTQLQQLAEEIDSNTQIWLGGAGAKYCFKNKQLKNRFQLLTDLNDFNSRLKMLNIKKDQRSVI